MVSLDHHHATRPARTGKRSRRLQFAHPSCGSLRRQPAPATNSTHKLSRVQRGAPIRWFRAPPVSTAHLSISRRPGTVLRVSSTVVRVPCGSSVKPETMTRRIRAGHRLARVQHGGAGALKAVRQEPGKAGQWGRHWVGLEGRHWVGLEGSMHAGQHGMSADGAAPRQGSVSMAWQHN